MYNSNLLDAEAKLIGRIKQLEIIDYDLYICFYFMYYTGIRPSEFFLISDAYLDRNRDWNLKTKKKNSDRKITDEPIKTFISTNLVTMVNYADFTNLQRLARSWEKYLGNIYEMNTLRETGAYLLRYMYVNRLLYNGLTTSEIQDKMGHTNLASTTNYINTIMAS